MSEVSRLPRIATLASREATFRQVLSAIRPQVAHAFVYLDGYQTTPAWLAELPNVTVALAAQVGNLHASGRFLCLSQLSTPSVVVSVDDDIRYPPDFVERLAGALQRFEGAAVVGVHGRVFIPPHQSYVRDSVMIHFVQPLAQASHVHELGTGTIAFVSDRLPLDPRGWVRNDMDDIIVAIEAQKRGLPRVAVARAADWLTPCVEPQADALWTATQNDDSEQSRRMRSLLRLYS